MHCSHLAKLSSFHCHQALSNLNYSTFPFSEAPGAVRRFISQIGTVSIKQQHKELFGDFAEEPRRLDPLAPKASQAPQLRQRAQQT